MMCKNYGATLKPFFLLYLVFSLLCSGYSTSEEKKIYLTESEMTELQTLISESQEEQRLLKLDLQTASTQLTLALNTQIQLQKDYQEHKSYLLEQQNELKKQVQDQIKVIERQNGILIIGGVTFGIVGIGALLASILGG